MDIFDLSVRQIVEKIKNAEITSVELCKLYIERIKKFEGFNIFRSRGRSYS